MMYYEAIYFTRPSMALEQSLMQSLYKVNLLGMALRLRLIVDRDHSTPLFSAQLLAMGLNRLIRGSSFMLTPANPCVPLLVDVENVV